VLLYKAGNSNSKSPSGSGDSAAVASAGTDNNSINALASSSSTSSSSSISHSSQPPQLSKVTAFEFMQVWNGLKGTTDIEQYVNVLDQIQPSDIPKGTFVTNYFFTLFTIS